MTTPLRLSVIELAREHRTKVTEFFISKLIERYQCYDQEDGRRLLILDDFNATSKSTPPNPWSINNALLSRLPPPPSARRNRVDKGGEATRLSRTFAAHRRLPCKRGQHYRRSLRSEFPPRRHAP
jgi:hypothetical protein